VTALVTLRGVRVHNLKDADVAFPLGKLTLVTGISGAGKSSLVFDTLHAEAQRRYLQSFSVAARRYLERFDQPDADWIGDLPPTIALRAQTPLPKTTVGAIAELDELLAQWMSRVAIPSCPGCGEAVRPHLPAEAAAAIRNLPATGPVLIGFPDRPAEGESVRDWSARLREEGWVRVRIGAEVHRLEESELPALSGEALVVTDRLDLARVTPERLIETVETTYRRGDGRLAAVLGEETRLFDRRWRCPRCDRAVPEPTPRRFDPTDPLGACPECHGDVAAEPCPACGGRRFGPEALSLRWDGLSIADLHERPFEELRTLFDERRGLSPPTGVDPTASTSSEGINPSARQEDPDRGLLDRIIERLARLGELGLGRLSASRTTMTLALGEAQRLRLERVLFAPLVEALYLLEEPTAGLHPEDVERLLPHLERLRSAGNTVVVVDHHPQLFGIADHLIDLGPGAGEEGGRVLYQGPPAGLRDALESVTREYLFAEPGAEPERRRTRTGEIEAGGIAVPLGVVCVVSGVSGAGKTRFVRETLLPTLIEKRGRVFGDARIDDAILLDRTPLPRSARSNPATFVKALDEIRDVFAETTDAKIRNYGPGAFSFNQPGGRCEECEGQGSRRVDMQFLADVRVTCPECLGRRFRKETLEIKVRGLDISEVLDLTVREAFRFFRTQRSLEKKLRWLIDVGLDHLRLGQPLETLSAGEGERLKLAAQLAVHRKPGCVFLLLEPSAGLHPADIRELSGCFDRLLSVGHSLVVVDHRPEMIAAADWLIELGAGGRLFAEGPPEAIAATDTPTGRHLRGRIG
jgi:excinuclease ABC subunit A